MDAWEGLRESTEYFAVAMEERRGEAGGCREGRHVIAWLPFLAAGKCFVWCSIIVAPGWASRHLLWTDSDA